MKQEYKFSHLKRLAAAGMISLCLAGVSENFSLYEDCRSFTGTYIHSYAEETSQQSSSEAAENSSDSSSDGTRASDDAQAGRSDDITISGIKGIKGNTGEKVNLGFLLKGGQNREKNYAVSRIEKVIPDSSADGFPFLKNDEASRVTEGSGNELSCSYSFMLKKGIDTGYYNVSFNIYYTRAAINGNTKKYSDEYIVTKTLAVRVKNKAADKKASDEEKVKEKKPDTEESDVYLIIKSGTDADHGKVMPLRFDAVSDKYKIKSVVPEIDKNFPFRSTSEAYKVTDNNDRTAACSYDFTARDDISTGYRDIKFRIYYKKDGETVSIEKTVSVYIRGKKKAKKKSSNETQSVPRLMVTDYSTGRKKIYPGDRFLLEIDIKNTSGHDIKNVKYTLSSESGEFLPYDSAGTSFSDHIIAGGTDRLSFGMKAASSLSDRIYQIRVYSEYEDEKNNSYEASDYISLQVHLKDSVSITDIEKPRNFNAGTTGDLTFSLNNTGKSNITDVTVKVKGKGFDSAKKFLGNISSGETKYADVVLDAYKATDSGNEVRIKVKYKNAAGEEKKYVKKIKMKVNEEEAEDLETASENTGRGSEKSIPGPVKIFIILAVIIAAVAAVIYFSRKRRERDEENEI